MRKGVFLGIFIGVAAVLSGGRFFGQKEPVPISPFSTFQPAVLSAVTITPLNAEVEPIASPAATPFPKPKLTPTLAVTPTPTPTPRATPRVLYTPQMIDGYFEKYSSQYNVDRNLLRKIAVCESGYNTYAANGIYKGMYQFDAGTWIAARQRMGQDTNPELRFNPEEAIKTAAFKLSKNEAYAWPKCR